MPQSLSNILLHLVFSTKDRFSFLRPELEEELYPYLATIFRACKCPALGINGFQDHIHAAFVLHRTVDIAHLVETVKTDSSKWVKNRGGLYSKFAWQHGYGVFSIGYSQLPSLISYIRNQKEHHKKKSFQEEYLELLRKYRVDYDERYLWD